MRENCNTLEAKVKKETTVAQRTPSASSPALLESPPACLRRFHSRPIFPNASAFQADPAMRQANPKYVHSVKIHPTALRHLTSACSQSSRYMLEPVVQTSSSCNTCRTGSAQSKKTLAIVKIIGPFLCQYVPDRVFARRAVAIATAPVASRFTPRLNACDARFAPALAAAPVSDAASKGQHHDPTSEGTLTAIAHATATRFESFTPRRARVIPTYSLAVSLASHAAHSRSPSDPYEDAREGGRAPSSPSSARALIERARREAP
ncbi:hypothetical protein BE221DRAFT_54060, partial [Ostreococcus tauri]